MSQVSKRRRLDDAPPPSWESISENLKDRGASFASIEIKCCSSKESSNSDSIRGVYANKDIKAGEEVVKLPHDLVISVRKAKESAIGKRILEKAAAAAAADGSRNAVVVPDRTLLQAFLLHLREGNGVDDEMSSTWRNYLRHCPQSYENPLHWSQVVISSSKKITILAASLPSYALEKGQNKVYDLLTTEQLHFIGGRFPSLKHAAATTTAA